MANLKANKVIKFKMKKCILLISVIVKYNMYFDNNSENIIKFYGICMKEKDILHIKVVTIRTGKDRTINWRATAHGHYHVLVCNLGY